MKKILFLIAVLFCWYRPADATVLGDAAAKLSPGQWVNFSASMGNLNATASEPAWDAGTENPSVNPGVAPGPAYDGSQPAWNSATRKLYIQTTEHGRAPVGGVWCPALWPLYPHGCWKPLWTYDDDLNSWDVGRTIGGNPTSPYPHDNSNNPQAGVHVWGGIAWDQGNQVLYVKQQETYTIRALRFCAPTSPAPYCAGQLGQYKALPDYNPSAGELLGQPMGFHRTYGKLYVLLINSAGSGCGSFIAYTEGTTGTNGTWAVVDDGAGCKFPQPASAPLLEAQYSTAKQVLVFNGGSRKAWRITNTGAIQALDDAPCDFHNTNNGFTTAAEDSNTGDIYYLGCQNQPLKTPTKLIKLNPTGSPGSQWSTVSSDLTTAGNICEQVGGAECASYIYATPISTYGVIGFWKFRTYGTAEYWLYKPSAGGGGGDIISPTVSITAPTAGASVSGPLVTVTASASDNVGVVGVQFRVDGTNVGAEDTSAPYSIAWNSTTVTDGSHAITAVARDAAGNTTISTTINVTVFNGGGGGGSDFTTRCSMPGVVKCVSFDSSSILACATWGCNQGIDLQGVTTAPAIDTTIMASGTGSLKFTIDSLSGANGGGAYWTNFSDDLLTQFGAGESFYVQWRQRFSPEQINTIYTQTCLPSPSCPGGNGNNAGGWKQISLTTGDSPTTPCPTIDANNGQCQVQLNEKKQQVSAYSSCTDIDVPTQNTNQRKMPQMYNACTPNASHGAPYWGIETYPGGDISFQSARPSPFCLYTQGGQPNGGFFPPNGNCFPYYPNEWMTFKAKITIGLRGAPPSPCTQPTCGSVTGASPNNVWGNSRIQLWVGREGQASQAVIDQNFDLGAGNSGQQKFGKVYLLPYHSYKNEAQVHPTAYTWYDDLIISRNDIPDPGGGPPVVNAPSQIRVSRR